MRNSFLPGLIATVALSLFTLTLSKPAHAWFGAGHMAIGLRSYDLLRPETKVKVDAILKTHPDYVNWVKEVPVGTPEANQGRYIFAIAATWPDRIKNPQGESLVVKFYDPTNKRTPLPSPLPSDARYPSLDMHKNWHYVDFPISMDGKPRAEPPGDSALVELPIFRIGLADTNLPTSHRAYYLSWLIHVVEDLHQPLHASERFTEAHPDGDQGGNGVKLVATQGKKGEFNNLHAYWDSLLGDSEAWPDVEKVTNALKDKEAKLLAGFDPVTRDSDDLRFWCMESQQRGRDTVYTVGPDSKDALPQPDADYHEAAERVAYQRGALAAIRLARVIELALNPVK